MDTTTSPTLTPPTIPPMPTSPTPIAIPPQTPVLVCPTCGSILAPDDAFCAHCGAKITNQSQQVGLGKQIYIYGISLLLPPFGLGWTWKYLRTDNPQLKRIGWIALILTVVSILLTIWATVGFLQGMQAQINSVSNFQNLPY